MTCRLALFALLVAGLAAPAMSRDTPTSRYMTATSLDGRYRAAVSTMRPVACAPDGNGSSDNVEHVLELTDTRTGKRDAVFIGLRGIKIFSAERGDGDPWPNETLFGSPKFSPDGNNVYLVMRDTVCDTQSWKDKPRVYRVPMDGKVEQFVIDGRLLSIVRAGPRVGYLIVQQQRIPGARGPGDPVLLVSPDGKSAMTIPGSEAKGKAAIAPWLKARGWTTY